MLHFCKLLQDDDRTMLCNAGHLRGIVLNGCIIDAPSICNNIIANATSNHTVRQLTIRKVAKNKKVIGRSVVCHVEKDGSFGLGGSY